MYSLALIYNSLISLYECISYTATLPSLRTRGYNSLQNMLFKLMNQMFTMPWCVLPNLFAHPIADMKLHLSKNNNIVLTKFTFEFVQLVTDNSVSWRHSLETVNFWISRIPSLWNGQHLSPILEVSIKFHGCQQTDKTIGTNVPMFFHWIPLANNLPILKCDQEKHHWQLILYEWNNLRFYYIYNRLQMHCQNKGCVCVCLFLYW